MMCYRKVAIKNIQMPEKMKQDFTGCATQAEIKEMDIVAHIKKVRTGCKVFSSFPATLLGRFGGQPGLLLGSFQRSI